MRLQVHKFVAFVIMNAAYAAITLASLTLFSQRALAAPPPAITTTCLNDLDVSSWTGKFKNRTKLVWQVRSEGSPYSDHLNVTDPLVQYVTDGRQAVVEYQQRVKDPDCTAAKLAAARQKWWTPFIRLQNVNPLSAPASCRKVAPGFDPAVLAARDSFGPITTLEQLKELQGPQRVLVVVPRFGLGNSLRNWVSAFLFALLSGRRIVLLHAGPSFGVFDSLCRAFRCSFDHIAPPVNTSRGTCSSSCQQVGSRPRVLSETSHPRASNCSSCGVSERAAALLLMLQFLALGGYVSVGPRNARALLTAPDPILFSDSHAPWDHWWRRDGVLSRCALAALGSSRYSEAAVNALLGQGPTAELTRVIERVVRRRAAVGGAAMQLPLVCGEGPAVAGAAGSGAELQFDVGLHLRTRSSRVETKQGAGCTGRGKDKKKGSRNCDNERERLRLRQMFLNDHTWQCIGAFLGKVGVETPTKVDGAEGQSVAHGRALSIFLATDNEEMRPEFVHRLSHFGAVHYSGAKVAHTAVAGAKDLGRLPTLAEWYLLAKSRLIVVVDRYLSTFALSSSWFGNGSLVQIPRASATLTPCVKASPIERGVWSKCDSRKRRGTFFKISQHY